MVDTKSILRKANLFEKIATYGKHEGFLVAMAQAEKEAEEEIVSFEMADDQLNME